MTTTPELIDVSFPVAGISDGSLSATLARQLESMRDLGVARSVLVADRRGPDGHPQTVSADHRRVAAAVEREPSAFLGALGVDPTRGVAELTLIREAVDLGFVAIHAVPHSFGLAPDHKKWYPIYATCCELNIPVQIELGIRRSPGRRVASVGRPISLDDVACDFPELKVIGLGPWPWVEEAISMAYKHPGVHLAVGGDDPGATDRSLARFADSWGKGKVVFASGGSALEEAVTRLTSLELRPAAAQALDEAASTLLSPSP